MAPLPATNLRAACWQATTSRVQGEHMSVSTSTSRPGIRGLAIGAGVAVALFLTASGAQTADIPQGQGGHSVATQLDQDGPLSMFTTALPGGFAANSYAYPMNAFGGTMPYAWAISAGELPVGLSIGPVTGIIEGIPEAPGDSTFTIRVTDDEGAQVSREFTLAITRSPADVECDLDVDAADALAALRSLAGLQGGALPQLCAVDMVIPAGDADGDGSETIKDVLYIRKQAADIP